MHKLLIRISLACFVFCSCFQEEKKPNLFIANSKLQLDRISFDSVHKINIPIVNKGNGVLVLDTATGSCGCTVPTLTNRTIQPLDSTILLVEFKPVDTGFFDKRIIIKSNTAGEFTVVSFSGWATRDIAAEPNN